MRYRILGPLEVLDDDGRPVALGGRRERTLLAALLLEANRVVSSHRLIDAVWGDDPPETAANALQVHISKLRKVLAASPGAVGPLLTEAPGYVLRTSPGQLDAERFEELAAAGEPDEVPGAESARLAEALALWSGAVLDGLETTGWGQSDVARLEELRVAVLERRIEADLALGRHGELVGELEALIRIHPLREGLRGQLMRALYRSGRQADALAVYRQTRQVLADELGIDPSPALRDLELAILQQSPGLEVSLVESPSAPDRPSGTVTLLFTDIEGSTRLWEKAPAAMDRALRRHDQLVRSAVEEAGGYVFKTVGDAFCAVFSTAKEAVEVAAVAQKALQAEQWPEEAALVVRMAVHTGECEERDGDYFGPPLNRVDRLRAVGHGGQILLSRATADMVRDVLPAGMGLHPLGTHRLKDLSRPEDVFQLVVDGLDADFAPLRSLDNPGMPNNLPELVSSFVGRHVEVAEVRNLVETSRLVTLVGAGGVGKTRLGLQVAADLLDGSGEGVWFVELATETEPEAVSEAVARALGIMEQSGRTTGDTLVEALADRYVLIVLDNCEHLIGACATLAEVVVRSCPRVSLLATSREPLGIDGERVFRVPSLSVPREDAEAPSELAASEAVTLFVERARAQAAHFSLTAGTAALVGAICRRLDGVPLAIELATARLSAMSLVDLHDRLDQRFRLLTGGSRTALPRQQTLRALVDWSYDLLNGSEQAVLRRLSVFVGGFELAMAEAVCGFGDVESLDVADLVGSLVDKSLVQAEITEATIRYRLLETIRQYAAEDLLRHDGSEIVATRDAHAQVFLSLAERVELQLTGPDQGRWLALLDGERGNLRNALVHLIDSRDEPTEALRLGIALERFWRTRGYYSEGIELLRAVLERNDTVQIDILRARALKTLGLLSVHRGDSTLAAGYVEDALSIARSVEDVVLTAELLHLIAFVRFSQGDYTAARALSREAVNVARASGSGPVIALTLMTRASPDDRPVDEIQADFADALAYFRQAGDSGGAMLALHNLANSELGAGMLQSARAHFEEAQTIARDLQDDDFVAFTLLNLGVIALLQHDVSTAVRCETESLTLARRVNDRGLLPYNVLALALCASARDEYGRAATLHGGADALLAEIEEAFEPLEADLRSTDQTRVRLAMGDEAFVAAYRAGQAMRHVEIVMLALAR